jgi:hypothetical protein
MARRVTWNLVDVNVDHPAGAQLYQAALTREHFRRELPTVLPRHRPLHAFDDRRYRDSVVLELLGAVLHTDAGALADVFIVRAFIGILESSPATHIGDQDGRKIRRVILDVFDELLQPISSFYSEPAFLFVGICANDLDVSARRIDFADSLWLA